MEDSFKGLADNLTKITIDLHKNLTAMVGTFDEINKLVDDNEHTLTDEQREKFANFVKGSGLEDILKQASEKVNK